MFDKLHIIITLTASIIVAVFCIFSDKTLSHCVLSIIITIILFFVIGSFAKHCANKWFPEKEDEEESEENTEVSEDEEVDTDEEIEQTVE